MARTKHAGARYDFGAQVYCIGRYAGQQPWQIYVAPDRDLEVGTAAVWVLPKVDISFEESWGIAHLSEPVWVHFLSMS